MLLYLGAAPVMAVTLLLYAQAKHKINDSLMITRTVLRHGRLLKHNSIPRDGYCHPSIELFM